MSEAEVMQFLVDRCGGLDSLHPSTKMAKLFKMGGPSRTREFRRINALPRRDWESDPDLDELVDLLSDHLKTPGGTMRLWPVQAQALRDAHDCRGLFGPIAVGKGKALISLLVSIVLKAKRPLLIVPASLREQTLGFVIPEMRDHWKMPEGLRIITYYELSQEKNARILEGIIPDLIIVDECHKLSNLGSGRGKRIKRYMDNNPETIFVALSGTVTNRSIKDYAHILWWCLKQGTPLPESWQELSQWADALDEIGDEENRSPPGALVMWAEDSEGRRLKTEEGEPYTARQGYRDRLVQTPGVVATKETELGVSLQLIARRLDIPREIGRQLAQLNLTWETPNGDLITEAVDLWRHARELACGFWYRWWSPKGFNKCLDKALSSDANTLAPIERQILKEFVLGTGRDITLEKALWNLNGEKRGKGLGSSKIAMGLLSKSTNGCLHSSTDVATFVGNSEGQAQWGAGVGATASRLTTIMQRVVSGDCSAHLATERLECWETMLRASPRLLSILLAANEAAKPPPDWIDARKAWKKYVRNTLKFNRRQLDTELQVWNESARKHGRPTSPQLMEIDEEWTAKQIEGVEAANAVKLADYEVELAAWRSRLNLKHCDWCGWIAIRDIYKINTVAEWIDDFAINDSAQWLRDVGGIVWTEHSAWGERLAKVSGFPYFGGGRKASREILECTSPMIASIRAHSEGKNLQHHHHDNLIATPPSSGKTVEQVLGRTHREGQKAPEVTAEIYMHSQEQTASVRKAFSDAKYLEHTLGSRQKLLYADKNFDLR